MMNELIHQHQFIKENFFVIDSTYLNKVKSNLYGYVLHDDFVSINTPVDYDSITSGKDGAFVCVSRQNDEIIITQDFMGCYGIYVFQKNEYFAISNSFQMLVDKIKKNFPLTLNRDYANHILVRTVSSVSMEGTLIEEIRLLPKNCRVRINVSSKTMLIEEADEKELSIPIDSKEGIEILDKWHDKWINIIRNLKRKTNNIEVDLSGGKDSRITFSLFLNAGVNLNEVTVKSLKDGLHTHKEDFEIATEISNRYNFSLNTNTVLRTNHPYTLEESVNISSLIMLGFHKEMHFKNARYDNPIFKFTGSGGESLRGYWNMELPAFLKKSAKIASYYTTPGLEESTEKIIKDSCDKIARKLKISDKNSSTVVAKLFEETYSRHHFGKATVEALASNIVNMMPLMDSLLYKLNILTDKNKDMELIYVLILDRYCKGMLDVRFDGNRKFKSETIKYAEEINKKYPYNPRENNIVNLEMNNVVETIADKSNPVSNIRKAADELLWKSFSTKSCKDTFTQQFSEEIYLKAKRYASLSDYYPMRHINAVLAITKAISDVQESQNATQDSIYVYLNHLDKGEEDKRVRDILYRGEMIRSFIKDITTARIDIKNTGSGSNDIIFECSDEKCEINTPNWFGKNGKGYQVESAAQEVKIKFSCVHDGELILYLRSRDVRDDDNLKIPVYIDYHYLSIDDIVIFDGVKEIWHDKPYEYKRNVKDGENHVITVKWGPHGYTQMEFLLLIEKLLGLK